jgi:8-oxo-dGTP pyrophosphatase MutT (NUDIX family)
MNKETIGKGKFLQLNRLTYTNKNGSEQVWESVERTKNAKAVCIIPYVLDEGKFVLIRQFRAPVDNYVIEFPAGMIDKGETPEEAAIRELREETGLEGKVIRTTPPLLSSAGMTNEAVYMCYVEIDSMENVKAQSLDESEDIEVFYVKEDEIGEFLDNAVKSGNMLAARMTSYLMGLGAY